jgi:hypothetical protein
MNSEREPTDRDLQAIEREYNSRLLDYPIETDVEKTLQDWSDLIVDYASMALEETEPDSIHERFVQCGNLAARAARAVRTGEYVKT